MFRWDTDGRDEELGTAVDDDADELVELALCVIVAVELSQFVYTDVRMSPYLVLRALPPT